MKGFGIIHIGKRLLRIKNRAYVVNLHAFKRIPIANSIGPDVLIRNVVFLLQVLEERQDEGVCSKIAPVGIIGQNSREVVVAASGLARNLKCQMVSKNIHVKSALGMHLKLATEDATEVEFTLRAALSVCNADPVNLQVALVLRVNHCRYRLKNMQHDSIKADDSQFKRTHKRERVAYADRQKVNGQSGIIHFISELKRHCVVEKYSCAVSALHMM